MNKILTPLLLSPNSNSLDVFSKIKQARNWEEQDNYKNFNSNLKQCFLSGRAIICMSATGIIIRLIAPFLKDKHIDSPIVCITPCGGYVIPLLGGHHGANDLALEVSEILGTQAVISTMSSSVGEPYPLDNIPHYWKYDNKDSLDYLRKKFVSEKKPPAIYHDLHNKDTTLPVQSSILIHASSCDLLITDKHSAIASTVVYPPTLILGVGSIRNADEMETIKFIENSLSRHEIAHESLAAISTVDLKCHEPAIHAIKSHYKIPIRVFSSDILKEHSSAYGLSCNDIVEQSVGTPSVCEAAALALADDNFKASIVMRKQVCPIATCAVAASPRPLSPKDIVSRGKAVGELHVIGIGPGDLKFLTQDAIETIHELDSVVGYSLYLDLISPMIKNKNIFSFSLGEEIDRVDKSISLACEGHSVGLVCSGDASVYAMASLVFEQLEKFSCSEISPPPVLVHPGISAMSMASSKSGAIIGHDFCAISLSDLLTPTQTIINRITHAAKGDFVIAFYNPQSNKRKSLLPEAINILKQYRDHNTPIILARNLTRAEENISRHTLGDFNAKIVDMMSLVMIGNSNSKTLNNVPLTSNVVYTPRGYHQKK